MTEVVESLANELEEHATSRADFSRLSENDRHRIARVLVLARVQSVPRGSPEWDNDTFRAEMRRQKERLMFLCGGAGIDEQEARAVWWSVVYDDIPPVYRPEVV
jgi:hypothetical protein